jgi:hypothetical protein
MAGKGSSLGWKLFGTLSAVGVGIATRKVVAKGWESTTGHAPPTNPEDPEVTWQEAMAYAVASGAAIGIARMLTARKAANYWRKATGGLPPELREVH